MPKTNFIIFGASGLTGQALSHELVSAGYRVTGVTRDPTAKKPLHELFTWAGYDSASGGWISQFSKQSILVNLTGENIAGGLWTKTYKQKILDSRVQVIDHIARELDKASVGPAIIIQSSATGYYGHRPGENLTENSQPGQGFLADTCVAWEKAASKLEKFAPLATIRTGIVLSPQGGYLKKILPSFQFFMGGYMGDGTQNLPWIHIQDVVKAIRFLAEKRLHGRFNLVAPQPLTQREFAKLLGAIIHRPAMLRIPGFLLKLIPGDFADEILLSDTKAYPAALLQRKYPFKFPEAGLALKDLLS